MSTFQAVSSEHRLCNEGALSKMQLIKVQNAGLRSEAQEAVAFQIKCSEGFDQSQIALNPKREN